MRSLLPLGAIAIILMRRKIDLVGRNSMRILLVEDEEKVSSFVARGLSAERFAVDVALDGQSGLDLATTYHYDLVILDLMLPKLDGSEVRSLEVHRIPADRGTCHPRLPGLPSE